MVDLPPPAATLVGGGGSGERNNPGRALRDPCSPLSDIPKGWGGPLIGEAIGTGDPFFPGAACVGGGSHPQPGAGEIGWGLPGWNGASHALAILRPG